MDDGKYLRWRCHTPNLLEEILNNPGTGILRAPLIIFANLLASVAERAAELNDARLNELMARLTLYEIADPEHLDYDKAAVEKLLNWKDYTASENKPTHK